jgi:hypothetical protein
MNIGDKVRELPKTGILVERAATEKFVDGKVQTETTFTVEYTLHNGDKKRQKYGMGQIELAPTTPTTPADKK